MRMMFGLVSLLVVIAIMLVLFRTFEVPTLQVGQQAKVQAIQISGRGQDGGDALSSFTVHPKMRGSTLDALTVTKLAPSGAMADFYGLKAGDEIVQVDGMKIGDISNDDPETAKAMVVQKGFQASLPITILRNGQRLTLPNDRNVIVTGAPTTSASPLSTPPSAAPPAANQPTPSSVQDQLKGLGIQTH
jgi:hypothetical protein